MTAEKEYGGALFDLATAENVTQPVLESLDAVCVALRENPQYVKLVQDPALPKAERMQMLDKAMAGAHEYVCNFVKILCGKNALNVLPACRQEYYARYCEAQGILPVTAVTAVPLTDAQKTALAQKLQSATGKTPVLENKVDPSVLGGVRLAYAGVQMDGTVRRRLDALREALLA